MQNPWIQGVDCIVNIENVKQRHNMTKMIFRMVKIQCDVIDDMKGREAGYKVFRQSDAMKGLLTALPLYFRKDTSSTFHSVNGSPQAEQLPLESTSKEAFFSRVETFSISFFSSWHSNLMFFETILHFLSLSRFSSVYQLSITIVITYPKI